MDEILDLPQQQEFQQRHYAGFWIRVGAYLIDTIILGVANYAIGIVSTIGYNLMDSDWRGNLVSLALGLMYFSVMESSEKQATLGKMALNLKVGDANGQRISLSNALGRYLAKIISAVILCIGFMMVGWDDKKQGLHDKIANTFVYER